MTTFDERRHAKLMEIAWAINDKAVLESSPPDVHTAAHRVLVLELAGALVRLEDAEARIVSLETSIRDGMLSTIRTRGMSAEVCKCGRRFFILRWRGEEVAPRECDRCAQWPPGLECVDEGEVEALEGTAEGQEDKST